ncbi:MAG: hypothetical protein QM759_05925 [Terricaulis sp.]
MPNVLDTRPMHAFARRAGQKIEDPLVRQRFERLAVEQLFLDPRNFQPVREGDLNSAPGWAKRARARGENLVRFVLNRSVCLRLHNVARRLALTCALAQANEIIQPHLAHAIQEARRFIAKIGHASFDVIAAKARRLARVHGEICTEEDLREYCPREIVRTTQGRYWIRITSTAELHAAGLEFSNCLARASYGPQFAHYLRAGLRQYWVLRDTRGAGLVVAMAEAPRALRFLDVRGPCNARPTAHIGDIGRLARALRITDHPPPPPPTAERTRTLIRMLTARCYCSLCTPESSLSHLRRVAAAP